MATQAERLAAVEQRIADHESRCEERLAEIKADGAATRQAVDSLKNRIWLVLLALLGWAMTMLLTPLLNGSGG